MKKQPAKMVGMALALLGIMAVLTAAHAQVTLTAGDASGSSSYNAAGHWSSGLAPAAGSTYDTEGYLLRGPSSGTGPYVFAGDSLTVGTGSGQNPGGSAFLASTGIVTPNNNGLIFKVNGQTLTVNNLILDGAQIRDGNTDGNNGYLNGNIYVTANGGAFMAQETNWIGSAITGVGPIYIGDNGDGDARRVIIFTSTFNISGNLIFNNTHTSANYSRATFAPGSVLTFTIGANGVNNQITGISGSGTSGTLQLNGNLNFNLAGADNTVGDIWDIVDPSVTTTYGATFAVNGFTQNGSLWDDPIGNGDQYEYNTATGVLTVDGVPEPSTFILAGLGLAGLALVRARRRQA